MNKRHFFTINIALFSALIIAILLSLSLGSAELSPKEMLFGLIGKNGYEFEKTIMRSVRLPRLLAAIIAGVGLSLSGVLLQSVMGNDLASPGTIGVNAGAGLAAVICLSAFPALSALLPIAAFFGAFAASLIIMGIAKVTGGGKATVILAGVACTSLFQAGISFFSILDTDVLSTYSAFSVGGFSGLSLNRLYLPALLVFISLSASLSLSGRIAALSLGDSVAAGLGIRVGLLRTFCLTLAAMSSAAVISFAGLLGFVGLVVPHITRKIAGQDMRRQLTAAPIIGALLVTLSDLAGRVVFAPSEISVGIIMAFIGAPFFFLLLLKRRDKGDA